MSDTSMPVGDELQQVGCQPLVGDGKRGLRILCHINHYFGSTSKFSGGSSLSAKGDRERIVRQAIARIRSLPYDVEIRICGFREQALIPVDVDLSAIGDPRCIPYESIERMFGSIADYDYFLHIEDDILVNEEFVTNTFAFNATSQINEIYLPNRMEKRTNGGMTCVDLEAVPGWSGLSCTFRDTILDIARNPHSGLFFLTKRQMRYAADRISLARRDAFFVDYMASAYANVHLPFLLWRAKSNPLTHYVLHLDNWRG